MRLRSAWLLPGLDSFPGSFGTNTMDEFNALDFAGYVRDRWLTVAVSCGVAVCLAFGVSRFLPRKYTATADILIQAPAGGTIRGRQWRSAPCISSR